MAERTSNWFQFQTRMFVSLEQDLALFWNYVYSFEWVFAPKKCLSKPQKRNLVVYEFPYFYIYFELVATAIISALIFSKLKYQSLSFVFIAKLVISRSLCRSANDVNLEVNSLFLELNIFIFTRCLDERSWATDKHNSIITTASLTCLWRMWRVNLN